MHLNCPRRQAHWGLASPSVELALYPVAILRNELPYAMDVVARKGGCLATAPPHGTVLLDWTAADSRNEGAGGPVVPPSWVYIRPHSPAGCSNRGMIRLQVRRLHHAEFAQNEGGMRKGGGGVPVRVYGILPCLLALGARQHPWLYTAFMACHSAGIRYGC